MIMNKLEMTVMEILFELLSQHLHEESVESYEKSQAGQQVSGQRFEPAISKIQGINVTP
jgi:hypothetical protein